MTNELLARIDLLNKQLEDYKSRCEKADKYIDIYLKNVDDIDINIAVVKDILNGRSDLNEYR